MEVPIKEGVFEYIGDGDKVQVISTQCPTCGEKQFPPAEICPKCITRGLNQIYLGRTGVITTYAVVNVKNSFWNGELPYTIVKVDLDGGGKFMSHLIDYEPGTDPIGEKVELVAHKAYTDKEGNDLIAPMYKIIRK